MNVFVMHKKSKEDMLMSAWCNVHFNMDMPLFVYLLLARSPEMIDWNEI